MKKKVSLISIFIVITLSSCIYFQFINQPSVALPNEIFTVSIAVTTEGGENDPYFGVCLPIGWTIPGDSLQCSGEYNEVIYYDSLISLEQENTSPAEDRYYWWAGKGVADTGAVGVVYAEFQIQTDSQVGMFSIDYMLGNSYYGVNQQRSDNHLIQITQNAIITSVVPDQGYQNFTMDLSINGFNTHFLDGLGTQSVWLSQDNIEIHANSYVINSNTSIDANFSIPLTAPLGLWDVNVETDIDGIITKSDGFEIFPPIPVISVTPDSIYIEVLPGTIRTKTLMIYNNGWNDLSFDLLPVDNQKFALNFDGIDDYVEVPDHISLNIINNITMEGWIKFDSGGTYQPRIISKGPDGEGYELLLTNESSICNLEIRIGPGSLISKTSLLADNWYHIASTYDGQFIKLFIDGVLDTALVVSGNLNTANLNLFIGQKSTGAWDKYKGVMDEIRIWNVARSESDIQIFMNQQLTGTEEGLVAYWQFNEGIGDTTYDKTINGNHGYLVGGVEWFLPPAPISPKWLAVSPDSGVCYPDSSMEIVISFDATELDTGNYYGEIVINSNDPFHSHLKIPVYMLVSTTAGIRNEFGIPTEYNLLQNYPNPFNPSTTIQYSTKERSSVELVLYDILGRQVVVLVNEEQDAGYYKINFNAARLASGIYFYRLQAGSFVKAKKMVLIK